MGWHKREIRDYCKKVLVEYENLEFDLFAGLIESFVRYDENRWSRTETNGKQGERSSGFAQRLITGLAAERYFESVHTTVPAFYGLAIENITQLGCGYDYRLLRREKEDFFAVEVKGMREPAGTVSLTPKEYYVANELQDRFFLFVVKNFQKSPTHEVFPNPLRGGLRFTRTEGTLIQVSWLTRI